MQIIRSRHYTAPAELTAIGDDMDPDLGLTIGSKQKSPVLSRKDGAESRGVEARPAR